MYGVSRPVMPFYDEGTSFWSGAILGMLIGGVLMPILSFFVFGSLAAVLVGVFFGVIGGFASHVYAWSMGKRDRAQDDRKRNG
jgi:hypothetical protein